MKQNKNTRKKYRWNKKVFFKNLIIGLLLVAGACVFWYMFLEALDYELSLSPRPDNAKYIVEKWMN